MHAIEQAAFVSVGRACGFAGLALFCLTFGLSYDPALAARTGVIVCLFTALVLLLYGLHAPNRPYKKTELWIILKKDHRPPPGVAQRMIGETLKRTYLWFAHKTFLVALVFFVLWAGVKLYPLLTG